MTETSTRTITINPVTRIEGHAKITIQLDDAGNVTDTQFHVVEFRGFEKFCEGRFFAEMPQITARICGICPVSHLLASAKACDAVLGVAIPQPAKLLRELLHMGQLTQSHALSFFHLSAPDLLLGYDADPAIRNVVGLIQQHPGIAIKGVRLRKYGQEIIKHTGGRKIHPDFPIPGGVNKALTVAERDEMRKGLPEAFEHAKFALDLIKKYQEAHHDE
ncbi:MAG TPA: nickel-dependent hydrogenase large subunit, partial [Verrucomicrobiae bacterium]